MAVVSDLFWTRWSSKKHVGDARPVQHVYVRKGSFRRDYRVWTGGDFDRILIPEENNNYAWYPLWQGSGPALGGADGPFDAWSELPNVREVTLEQTFDENGINRMTLTMDDLWMEDTASASPMAAVYHVIKRGYFAPYRGFAAPGFPNDMTATDWFLFLFRNAQIRVDQGYGEDTVTTVFSGLIDDIDLRTDTLVITARDFGQQLVDCRVFGANKSKHLHDPVTFVDRYQADEKKKVGAGNGASSTSSGHPVRFVADENRSSFWESDHHHGDNVTEFVDVELPAGRYDSVYIDAERGQELYIGLLPRDREPGVPSTVDGVDIPAGWVDGGNGEVPGGNGGWHYIKKIGAAADHAKNYSLDGMYRVGPDTILRVGVRNLTRVGHSAGGPTYAAQVSALQGWKRFIGGEAKKNKWILVDDPSDVVRVLVRWAGFPFWQIEDVGARMTDRLVVNRGNFYIDVIKKIADTTGYAFFMSDPLRTDAVDELDQELTVPIFRQAGVLRDGNGPDQYGNTKPLRAIRDTDLLTDIQAKLTDEPLSYIIRVRGAIAKPAQGGRTLGGDSSERVMYVYKPPWTTGQRMGGQIKHFTHTYPQLKTVDDCQIGCYLVALAEALGSATAIAQIPGNPEFSIDDLVYLRDESTGLQTRMYLASRSSTFTSGKDTKWTMTLGGALVDTPDITEIRSEIEVARRGGSSVPPVSTGRERQPITGD